MIELNRQIQAQNRQLEEMALTDALTGLPNRRAIDLWATRQLHVAARHDFSMWVVMAVVESLLSYSENVSGNEFTLRHELDDRTVQITFEPASALISYQGKIGKGAFHAHVEGDALEYGWEKITRCDGVQPLRKFRSEEDETPAFSTKEMSEIIIPCVVLEPASET